MGVVLDPLQLFERLTAREFLATMGELRGDGRPRSCATAADELFDTLQLADDADRQIAGYSHGMRKKTALAAAVLHRPRLLLLDEPFEGVDPVSARTMRAMLDRFRAGGGTVVLSSHVMDLVERLCDHVAVIHHGTVVASGPTDAAAARPPARGRLHRRGRGRPTPTRTRWPGWVDRGSTDFSSTHVGRRRHASSACDGACCAGAIRHGGGEQLGAVAVDRRLGHDRARRWHRRGRRSDVPAPTPTTT